MMANILMDALLVLLGIGVMTLMFGDVLIQAVDAQDAREAAERAEHADARSAMTER